MLLGYVINSLVIYDVGISAWIWIDANRDTDVNSACADGVFAQDGLPIGAAVVPEHEPSLRGEGVFDGEASNHHLGIGHISLFVDDRTDDHTTFDMLLLALNGIFEVVVHELNISVNALAITTSEVSDAKVGDAYNQTFTSNGAVSRWEVSAGEIPDGLTLNSSSGLLSGTLTNAGDYNFTIKASNEFGSASKSYSVTISENADNYGGSSGGGCDSGLGIFGLAVLAVFAKKLRS